MPYIKNYALVSLLVGSLLKGLGLRLLSKLTFQKSLISTRCLCGSNYSHLEIEHLTLFGSWVVTRYKCYQLHLLQNEYEFFVWPRIKFVNYMFIKYKVINTNCIIFTVISTFVRGD